MDYKQQLIAGLWIFIGATFVHSPRAETLNNVYSRESWTNEAIPPPLLWTLQSPRQVKSALSRWILKGLIVKVEAGMQEAASAETITGVVQQWASRARWNPWVRWVLPLLVSYPEGNQQYFWNRVYSNPRLCLDVYVHVWAPKGQTQIHDHSNRHAYIVPLGNGLLSENYSWEIPDQAVQAKTGALVLLRKLRRQFIDPWIVEPLTQAGEDIHKVLNLSTKHRLVLETYTGRRTSSKTFIPLYGEPGFHILSQTLSSKSIYTFHDILLEEAVEIRPENVSQALAGASWPAYTAQDEAILNAEQALHYLHAFEATLWRAKDGTLLLDAGYTPDTSTGFVTVHLPSSLPFSKSKMVVPWNPRMTLWDVLQALEPAIRDQFILEDLIFPNWFFSFSGRVIRGDLIREEHIPRHARLHIGFGEDAAAGVFQTPYRSRWRRFWENKFSRPA